MSGRVIDLKPIVGTERKPLALQRCAIGHRDRLSVQFESSAVGQLERGRFGRRARGEQDSLESRGAYFGVPWVEIGGRQVAVTVFNRLNSRAVCETFDLHTCRKFKTRLL